jgi:hypothetical protein
MLRAIPIWRFGKQSAFLHHIKCPCKCKILQNKLLRDMSNAGAVDSCSIKRQQLFLIFSADFDNRLCDVTVSIVG